MYQTLLLYGLLLICVHKIGAYVTFLQSPSTSQLLSGLIEIGKQKRSSSLRLLNGDIKRDLEVMVLYATKKKKSRRTAKDRFSEAFEGGGSLTSSVDFGSSVLSVGHGKPFGGKKGKNAKGLNQSQSSQDIGLAQPSLDSVMEKIRRHQGGKREWKDETLRDLAKSR